MDVRNGEAFLVGPTFDRQIETEDVLHLLLETFTVPLLGIRLLGDGLRDQVVDHIAAHFGDGLVQVRVA